MNKYTYSDSESGTQTKEFTTLSSIINHIEGFGWNGDSQGIVFQNEDAILGYESRESGLTWINV